MFGSSLLNHPGYVSVQTGLPEEGDGPSQVPVWEGRAGRTRHPVTLSVARAAVSCELYCSCVQLQGPSVPPATGRKVRPDLSPPQNQRLTGAVVGRARDAQGSVCPLAGTLRGDAEPAAQPRELVKPSNGLEDERQRNPDINIKDVIPKVCRNKREVVIGHSGVRVVNDRKRAGNERKGR